MMPADNETRRQAMKAITRILSRGGSKADVLDLRTQRYANVPSSTWHRWVSAVRDSGVPGRKAAIRAKKRATRRTNTEPDPKATALKDTAEQMPEVIRVDDIAGTPMFRVIDRIRACVAHADEVLAHCKTIDGRLRNPKLYIQASRHHLEALKTSAYITDKLMEAQRLEAFHQAILDEIAKIDLALAERIIERLEQMNREMVV